MMDTRTHSFDSFSFDMEFPRGMSCLFAVLALVLGMLIGAAQFGTNAENHTTLVSSRSNIVQVVNTQSGVNRQAMARSILSAEQTLGNGNFGLFDDAVSTTAQRNELTHQLQAVETTGQKLTLQPAPTDHSWGTYWTRFVPILLLSSAAILGMWQFLSYVRFCSTRRHRLVALEKRSMTRGGRIWFFVYTSFPIGWVFYLISRVGYKRDLVAKRRKVEEAEQ